MSGFTWLKTINSILLVSITSLGTIDFTKLHPQLYQLLIYKNSVLFILAFTYVLFYLIEVTKTQKIDRLYKTIKMHEDSNHKLSSTCDDFSQEFYNGSNSLKNSKKLELHWSFKHACKTICNTISKTIEDYNPSIAFEISYIQRLDNNVTEMTYWDENESKSDMPSILGKKRAILTSPEYFYEIFFLNGIKEVVLYRTRQEIEKNFIHQSKDSKKYLQYIGVPLSCPDGNIFGLLQFIVKKNNEKNQTLNKYEFKTVKLYLECFRSKLILFSKLEKLLTSKPSRKTKSI